MTALEKQAWQDVCERSDLVAGSGVCALVGSEQIALFYLPGERQQVYALGNRDPMGGANVMSRGILGDVGGQLVVASPLYKQHFSLDTGACLEQESVRVEVYDVRLEGDRVLIGLR
jgi:nitrite reductase (NADH) small subunit